MRGKGFFHFTHEMFEGITPACAGKSIIEATSRALNEDHPRVCGEKNSASVIRNCKQGSPPRMRGKGEGQGNSHQERRITPAYAGKSRIRRACTDRHRDHPRMCGEKCEAYARIHGMVGSPPRMRGKALENGGGSLDVRITPACAGKSHFATNFHLNKRDHPRMCGEKWDKLPREIKQKGSPPHVRGKECVNSARKLPVGITPACAGKRLKRSRSTVPPVAIVPLFPSVCNKPVVSDGSPAGRDAPLFLPAENAVPASPAYNLRSL